MNLWINDSLCLLVASSKFVGTEQIFELMQLSFARAVCLVVGFTLIPIADTSIETEFCASWQGGKTEVSRHGVLYYPDAKLIGHVSSCREEVLVRVWHMALWLSINWRVGTYFFGLHHGPSLSSFNSWGKIGATRYGIQERLHGSVPAFRWASVCYLRIIDFFRVRAFIWSRQIIFTKVE